MIRRLFAGLMCAFLLQEGTLAATPALQSSFSKALRGTVLGNNPVQAYFLVRMLKDTGAPNDEVEALQRELLHSYSEQLGGLAAAKPLGNVEEAIARGKNRDSVLDVLFASTWQTAFGKALEVHWSGPNEPAPYFTTVYRTMRPMAPGLWAAELNAGQTKFMLSLRLVNTKTLPLPIHRPEMVWGGEAGTGRGGLSFTCNWDEVPPPKGNRKADEVFILAPGAATRPMVCETDPAGTYWKEQLPLLLSAAQAGGQQPQLLSHEFDSRYRLNYLEGALGSVARQEADWRKSHLLSQQQVGRQWRPAPLPLDAPVGPAWTWSPNDGWAAAGEKLQWFMGATLMAIALFSAGRALLRSGMPVAAVAVGTVLIGTALQIYGVPHIGSGGKGYTAILLWLGYIGPILVCVLGLHTLHKLLDAEELSWWQTMSSGWRRIADLDSYTSRAQFWGFFAHCLWWWGLMNMCLKPLHLWLGGILLFPMLSLVVRRLRSMSSQALLEMAISTVCYMLLALG
jgi:hypothetical protein